MKNTDWKIFIATLAYTYLFYIQEPGLNYLVFSAIIIVLAILQNTKNIKNIAWLTVSTGTLISGFFIYFYGTNLPVVANTISLIFLAGITYKNSASLIISALNSLSSYILAIPLLVINFIKSKRNKDIEQTENILQKSLFKKILLLFFPIFVVFVFFVLYRGSNPLFMKITEDINLDWLSFPLIKFFLTALLLMYAFFVQNIIKPINNLDDKLKDDIKHINEEEHKRTFFTKFISLESEVFTGTALLVMLNLLIAFLNAIDINYLWLKADLPQGLVFSDYLHSGTFTLIVSIVFAIFIILFFFRGVFNFNKKGKLLKILGFLWIIQNIVMIVSAMLRNHLYINDYGFTHKRIGVDIFLLLAVIGLFVTIAKIAYKKNTLFLFRKNTWAFYIVLIVATVFNWDIIITKHNVNLANKQYVVSLDKRYLAELSHVNTYALAQLEKYDTPYEIYESTNTDRWNIDPLQTKIQNLLDYENRNQWQENCFNKNINIQELKKLNDMGKIAKLDLFSMYLEDITEYKPMSNIKGVALQNNYLENKLQGLKNYPKLEVINLRSNNISSLDSLPVLKNLTHLNMEYNKVQNYSDLEEKTPNISHLNISRAQIAIDEEFFPSLTKLKSINLSQSNMDSWNFLKTQINLKEIIYTTSNPSYIQIPFIESLEKVDLSSTKVVVYKQDNSTFLDSLASCKNINSLNLYNCALNTSNRLLNYKTWEPLFPNLENLNLRSNNLQENIGNLYLIKSLKSLDLSSNKIIDTKSLSKIAKLEELYLNNNYIRHTESFGELKNLKKLILNQNKIGTIEDLIGISTLNELNISNNNIREIDSIYKLTNISTLAISNNKVEDLSPLLKMERLTHLSIAENPIKDYTVLHKMKNLKYLSLGNVDLKIVETLKKALPKTEIDYYSKNLGKQINYFNKRRTSYSESF